MDLNDDLQAKKCPKCNSLMIKQEIDEIWYCENCENSNVKKTD